MNHAVYLRKRIGDMHGVLYFFSHFHTSPGRDTNSPGQDTNLIAQQDIGLLTRLGKILVLALINSPGRDTNSPGRDRLLARHWGEI